MCSLAALLFKIHAHFLLSGFCSISLLLLTCRASFQYPRVCAHFPCFFSIYACMCSVAGLLFNIRAYVLASRLSFQNPPVCFLAALLFNIHVPVHLLCFLKSALVLPYSTYFQYPRVCARFPRFRLTSALVFLVRLLFNIRSPAHLTSFFNIHARVHLQHFF